MTHDQQGDLLFDDPSLSGNAAAGRAFGRPPKAWIAAATAAAASAKWKALTNDQQEEVLLAMWVYANACASAAGSPLRAGQAEGALLGWVNSEPEMAKAMRTIHGWPGLIAMEGIPPVSPRTAPAAPVAASDEEAP